MSNSEKHICEALNTKTNFISQTANENIQILEENKKRKKSNYIIDNKKKILKSKILIPNKKCHFKKINNTLQEKTKDTLSKKNNTIKKLNPIPIRKQSCGLIKRNNNYQLYASNSFINSHIKNNINNLKGNITETSYKNLLKNERLKLIPKSPMIKPNNNNYYINNNSPNNYNNIGIKIIENNKNNKEYPLYITKIDQRQNILNNNINNNNFNGNITYNNNVNLNFNNDKNNEIIYDIPKRIYINNKEIDIIKKNIRSKSPSFRPIKLSNKVSPIKIKNINFQQGNNIQIFNKNKLIKVPIIKTEFSRDKKLFPDNYSFHEITHLNSPKKIIKNYNSINYNNDKNNHNCIIYNDNKNNNITIGTTNLYLEELYDDKNNYLKNRISNNFLLNSKRFKQFNNKIPLYNYQNLNYSNITPNNRLYANINKNFEDEFYNNNNIYPNNKKINLNNNDFILPKKNKIMKYEYNDNYMDLENEEIDEIAQSIHFFGEQMRKRNKNYNKNNNISLDKKNKCIKIRLKKNNSYNDINKINEKTNNLDRVPFSSSNIPYNEDKNKYGYYLTSNINKSEQKLKYNYNSGKKVEKLNRFSHNIIKRKRIKKLIMEKSQNEEFLSNSNKMENKNNTLKDKISNYENSILDNDSINEIIKEFEKEIEAEEKKEKNIKNYQKRNNNISHNDTLKFSFFSDNDFSIISKDSTNNSKNKIKKKHYYKTKNMDMEKDNDFIIYGNKSKSVKK